MRPHAIGLFMVVPLEGSGRTEAQDQRGAGYSDASKQVILDNDYYAVYAQWAILPIQPAERFVDITIRGSSWGSLCFLRFIGACSSAVELGRSPFLSESTDRLK